MKNNNTRQVNFEGLYLSEALEGNFIKLNRTLVLEVETGEVEYVVKSGFYENRDDGNFSLEVIFPDRVRKPKPLTDLVVAIYEHPDAPYWLLDAIGDGINDNSSISWLDPDYVRMAMAFTTPKSAEVESD